MPMLNRQLTTGDRSPASLWSMAYSQARYGFLRRVTRSHASRTCRSLRCPHPVSPPAHPVEVDSGVGVAFADFHLSFRMDSFQMVLACSSEPLNGLSVPRSFRYSAFVIFDILHHRMGGAVCSESYLELSSVLLASIRVHLIIHSRPRFGDGELPGS